jgi:hypothetical protein
VTVVEVRLKVMLGEGDWLRFEVIDCGPGIAEAQQQRLFEAFRVAGEPWWWMMNRSIYYWFVACWKGWVVRWSRRLMAGRQ